MNKSLLAGMMMLIVGLLLFFVLIPYGIDSPKKDSLCSIVSALLPKDCCGCFINHRCCYHGKKLAQNGTRDARAAASKWQSSGSEFSLDSCNLRDNA